MKAPNHAPSNTHPHPTAGSTSTTGTIGGGNAPNQSAPNAARDAHAKMDQHYKGTGEHHTQNPAGGSCNTGG